MLLGQDPVVMIISCNIFLPLLLAVLSVNLVLFPQLPVTICQYVYPRDSSPPLVTVCLTVWLSYRPHAYYTNRVHFRK